MNEFKNLNQTEMQEIRPNIFVMVSYWISQHLILVGIIIAVLLSLCSCQKAAAEGMIQSDRDYIHSIFDSYWGENEWATVEDYMDAMPYFIIFKESGGGNYVLYLAPYSTNDYYEARYVNGDSHATGVSSVNIIPWLSSYTDANQRWSFGTDYGGLIPYSLGNLQWSSSRGQYGYAIFTTGILNGTYIGYRVDISDRRYSDSGWNRYWYDSVLHGVSSFSAGSGRYGMYVDLAWTKTNFNAAVICGEYTSEYHCEQNVFPVSYTDDDRLKFSTSLRGDGEKLLNTDLSGFVHWGPADNQDISDLVLTLDCDGTEVTVALDDTNSEIVNVKNPNYSKSLVYITPYSEFGLDEYEDVTIVKCDFTHTDYTLIGDIETDYKISCSYVLKNETAPIESESIEHDDDTETVKVTTAEITAKNDVVNMQNYYYSYTGGGGQELVIPEGFTVKIITCVDNTSLADAINQLVSWRLLYNSFGALYDIGEAAVLEVTSISNSDDFLSFMEDEIKANSYGDYYDIVCYYYCPDAASAEVDQFYYYITSSGKLRTINQTLADIWVETNQTAYNTAAIYDYMYTRLNDFEDKSLESFNDMVALDRQRNTWLSTISSGVNTLNQTSLNGFSDVVNAINAIDIPVPTPFDDTDILGGITNILGKLDDLIDAVEGHSDNEDDTVSEAIAYYQAHNSNGMPTSQVFLDNKMSIWMAGKVHFWLQGSNASDTKTSLLSDAFDTLTSMYQAMSNEQYFFSGISGYLDDLTNSDYSSDGETDPDKYYINFFFKPGYDPDRYDGGGIITSE